MASWMPDFQTATRHRMGLDEKKQAAPERTACSSFSGPADRPRFSIRWGHHPLRSVAAAHPAQSAKAATERWECPLR